MKRGLVILCMLLVASAARADTVTVGLFAPSAPFGGTAARVEFAAGIARAIGTALGKTGVGRVYGRAGDFAAAAKKGEVQVAIVDARYLAVTGTAGAVIAVGTRGGGDAVPWQLVTRGAKSVLELRGKTLIVPSMGGREADFVRNALYGGELPRDFFAKVEVAPDTAAALASLGLGKADAAIVPAGPGEDAPAGAQVIATLPAVSLPLVVAYGLDDAARAKVAAALAAFQGNAAIGGFRAAGADVARALGHRMAPADKRAPMVLPDVHVGLGDLVAGRAFAIPHADVTRFAVAPVPAP